MVFRLLPFVVLLVHHGFSLSSLPPSPPVFLPTFATNYIVTPGAATLSVGRFYVSAFAGESGSTDGGNVYFTRRADWLPAGANGGPSTAIVSLDIVFKVSVCGSVVVFTAC
jgi:hypothetical protein